MFHALKGSVRTNVVWLKPFPLDNLALHRAAERYRGKHTMAAPVPVSTSGEGTAGVLGEPGGGVGANNLPNIYLYMAVSLLFL